MELDVVPDRAIVTMVVGAITGSTHSTPPRRGPYAPPSCHSGEPRSDHLHSSEVRQLCHTLLHELLLGHDRASGLIDELAPEAVLWTPAVFASTNVGVLEVLLREDWHDGPLSDRMITITNTDVALPRVLVEWRVTGRFTQPFFVADDVLIEPTGRLVETAGVLVVTFGRTGVVALHLYHDPFAILEQILTGSLPVADLVPLPRR
jgi:hypothetical protein